jgi:hypothetical protein
MAHEVEAGTLANGLSDRVTVPRGRSASVLLLEKADLVVAEFIGDDLFAQSNLLPLADVASRLAPLRHTATQTASPPSCTPWAVTTQMLRRLAARAAPSAPLHAQRRFRRRPVGGHLGTGTATAHGRVRHVRPGLLLRSRVARVPGAERPWARLPRGARVRNRPHPPACGGRPGRQLGVGAAGAGADRRDGSTGGQGLDDLIPQSDMRPPLGLR